MNYPKAILVGLDGAMYDMIDRFIDELPYFKKIRKEGFFSPAWSFPTCDTPTNWTTIATGSAPSTHGITSFRVHKKGEPVDISHPSFNSRGLCRSEYIWQALERQGKRSILINYPTALPPTLKDGIIVGGNGISPSNWNAGNSISYHTAESSGSSDGLIEFKKAEGWTGLPAHKQAREAQTGFHGGTNVTWTSAGLEADENAAAGGQKGAILHIAVLDTEGNGFDTAVVSTEKDASKALAVLKTGVWTDIIVGYYGKEGEECGFRMKLQELSPDGRTVNIVRTMCHMTEGWGYPESVCRKITDTMGTFIESLECLSVPNTPPEVRNELLDVHCDWYVDCAKLLLEDAECDLLVAQLHSTDGMNHTDVCYVTPDSAKYDPEKADYYWSLYRENYKACDRFIGRFMEECSDKNTVVAVVSDHAIVHVDKIVYLGGALEEAGLTVYKPGNEEGSLEVDITRSKVCTTTANYLWVNLKGREEGGIVEQGEAYETVMDQAIETLYSIIDPETGECPIEKAVRTRDAEDMGQKGENMPDIVYFFIPGYTDYPLSYPTILPSRFGMPDMDKLKANGGIAPTDTNGHHHVYLPDASAENISNRAIFGMIGPGVKAGTTADHVSLADVAPTLCRLMGVDAPADTDGSVIQAGIEE